MQLLTHPIRILILGIVGALLGAFINWAIYRWPYFLKRSISPWMKPDDESLPRKPLDRMPIVGWLGLRRDQPLFGKTFWLRPMLIEIVWMIGLPWFYYWQLAGGLTGVVPQPIPASWPAITQTWFIAHAVLIALMFIATFIDFDERTIPDWVTIPGTLIALLFAACCPWFRLPENGVADMAGNWTISPLHFASPLPLPDWHHGPIGLILAIAIICISVIALLPKICTMRYGIGRGMKIMFASLLRPRRKTVCAFRTSQRQPFGISYVMGLIGILAIAGIVLVQQNFPAENWNSLFSSLIGLGFGGGMVWSIRIVARYAMGREAMGFGDVTLMAMIGAFLGWQSALLTFAIAPFAALVIVFVCFLVTKENELAFGPYLCFGCMVLIFGWSTIWPAAAAQFSFLGPWMMVVLMVALVLMAVLLTLIQWVKGLFLGPETEQREP
jgi:leader peptidase (prepilin peptidase)/N-methyltransferase